MFCNDSFGTLQLYQMWTISIAVEWNVEVVIEIVRFISHDYLIEKACVINMKLFLKAAATFNFVLREWQNLMLQFHFDSWSNIIDKHRQIIMSEHPKSAQDDKNLYWRITKFNITKYSPQQKV